MSEPNSLVMFHVKASYPYYDQDEKGMRETSLSRDFIADSKEEAINLAWKWATNRLNNIIKDMYGAKEVGCIKVGEREVMRPREDGSIEGGFYQFFEWKYDWPGTLQNYINSWKADHKDERPQS